MKSSTQIGIAAPSPLLRSRRVIKQLSNLALMLTLGVASIYGHEISASMTFSGTSANSANNLQEPDTSNDEDNFAGKSNLGAFTVRLVRAIANSPTVSNSCSGADQLYLLERAGGGVFRFQGGSLLYVHLTRGADCIDLATNTAHCTLLFQITGGTGRFKGASGVLKMTETVSGVLSDALHNPVLFGVTGEFTGTVLGALAEDEAGGEQP